MSTPLWMINNLVINSIQECVENDYGIHYSFYIYDCFLKGEMGIIENNTIPSTGDWVDQIWLGNEEACLHFRLFENGKVRGIGLSDQKPKGEGWCECLNLKSHDEDIILNKSFSNQYGTLKIRNYKLGLTADDNSNIKRIELWRPIKIEIKKI